MARDKSRFEALINLKEMLLASQDWPGVLR